jgi:hypothetical protein
MEEGEDRGHGIDGHARFHWILCGAVAGETECGSVEFGVSEMVFLVWNLDHIEFIYIHCGAFAS